MSVLVLNRGGASGGLKPELTVKAPAGCKIDLLRDGLVLKTYTLSENETEHTFTVSLGAYVVRGSLDGDTKEIDVSIDIVGQYRVEIAFVCNYTMLYDYGDECVDVSGGWAVSPFWSNARAFTKNADSLYGSGGGTNNVEYAEYNSAALDLADYTKVFLRYKFYTTKDSYKQAAAFNLSLNDGVNARQQIFGRGYNNVTSTINENTYRIIAIPSVSNPCHFEFVLRSAWSSVSSWNAAVFALALFKEDDIEALCAKAGISYPGSLDSLIASTSSISAILNNEDAIKYMAANCTGDFMGAFVTNSACRSALDASPHRVIVNTNKHWEKFLAMV